MRIGRRGLATTAAIAWLGTFAVPAAAAEVKSTPLGEAEPKTQPEDSPSLPFGIGAESDAPAPTTGVSFLATTLSESGFIPPDTTGDVGPSQIVVPLNGRIKIFSKTGTQLYSDPIDTFFNSVRNGAAAFDPRVQYDRLSARWFVTAINGGNNNRVMIAYSAGPEVDALSDFSFVFFTHTGDSPSFGDYATLGIDKNAVYLGTNNFNPGYLGSSLYVLDKADVLAGTASPTLLDVGTAATGMFAPHVAENDDPNATVGYVVGVDNAVFGQVDFARVTDPAGTPALSAIQGVVVPSTSNSCNVPAIGTTSTTEPGLDGLDDRLYEVMVAKDPGTGADRLWTAHNLTVDGAGASVPGTGTLACAGAQRLGSRFYEIGTLDGTASLVQSGTLFDPAASNQDSFWIPSIAANGQGHAVIGTSIAGPARVAGVAVAQRFAGEPAGTLSPFTLAQPGQVGATYNVQGAGTRNRWGDYSMTTVDPNDGMTFWTFQEYVSATNQWGVRVIEVKAPPPATPATATPGIVATGQPSVTVSLTGAPSNGSGFYDPGPGFTNRLGVAIDGGVVVNSVTFVSPTTLTLNLNTTGASVGPHTVTATNPDGQTAAGTVLNVAAPPQPQPEPQPNDCSAEEQALAAAKAKLKKAKAKLAAAKDELEEADAKKEVAEAEDEVARKKAKVKKKKAAARQRGAELAACQAA